MKLFYIRAENDDGFDMGLLVEATTPAKAYDLWRKHWPVEDDTVPMWIGQVPLLGQERSIPWGDINNELPGGQRYSTTTFKDNGYPILLNADGTRSVFCDLVDEDEVDAQPAAVSAPTDERPIAEVAEDCVFLLRKQPNGERWPAGTKLYARAAAPVSGQGASIGEAKPWEHGESISPRQLFDDDEPDGYMESDGEFMERNRFAAVWMLENASQLCVIDSRPRSEEVAPQLMRQAVATVISRVGNDLRVGWLRPERCDVGTLLFCLAPAGTKGDTT